MNKRNTLKSIAVSGLFSLAAGLLVACSGDKPQFSAIDVTGADYAKDFALTDHNGQPRSLKDFSGKVVVLFFGYTQCPDVCPTSMTELAEVKKLLGADGDKLQGLFVTVDPARDTPEVLPHPKRWPSLPKTTRFITKNPKVKLPPATPWTTQQVATSTIHKASCVCTPAMAAAHRRWLRTSSCF
jgi:SCO1/SenC